jgi:hypothetical protein
MKNQRRFAPTGGQFTPESVARFIGIRSKARLHSIHSSFHSFYLTHSKI